MSESQETDAVSEWFEDCFCGTSQVDSPVVITPCNHKFHFSCLVRHAQTNGEHCPNCRAEITPQTLAALSVEANAEFITEPQEPMRQADTVPLQQFEALERVVSDQQQEIRRLTSEVASLQAQYAEVARITRALEAVFTPHAPPSIEPIPEEQPTQSRFTRRTTRAMTRAASERGASERAPSTVAPSQAPSSVRRAGGQSMLMRRWLRFYQRRSFSLRNSHPTLSRRAVQGMVRDEWRQMSPTQRNQVQL